MPIVSKKPLAPPTIKPVIPKVEPDKNQSVFIDTRYQPLSSLLKYTQGAVWTVNYYSQYHDRDNATYAQDPGQSPIYQQFRKIERLELRVESPLNQQQDQESKGFSVKGSAYLPLSIIPNAGDMFTADVGDGREGVFQIDNSEKKSIYKESVYLIEYTMLYYSDNEPTRRKDLETKVIHNLHYVKEFAQYGQNALITTEQYSVYTELAFHLQRLKKQYFQWFFSKEYSTLLLPHPTRSIYDAYLTKAVRAIYNTQDLYEIQLMRVLNIEDDEYLKRPTIWDALLTQDICVLDTAEKQVGIASIKAFHKDPMMESIRYSYIDYIVYPKPKNQRLDFNYNFLEKRLMDISPIELSSQYGNTLPLIADNEITHLGKQLEIISPILKDDYYIFTQAFYDDLYPQSALEVLVRNYLQKEANHPALILKLMKNCYKWGMLEKYYYTPVLMILTLNIIKELS